MSIDELIHQYLKNLRSAGASSVFESWSCFEPANDEELGVLAKEVSCELPEELILWLRTVRNELPFGGNYAANKLGTMVRSIQETRKVDFNEHLANIISWEDGRFDDERIARTYWQPQWVPLAQDGCGNEYCYDLAPGSSGQVGQIIAMEFQDGQGPYLARWGSLEERLRYHLEALANGKYTMDEEGFIEFD